MGAEELLPLRGSPSHSSTDGSRRGSPERGSSRSVLQAFPQTGGLSAFAAFVTGALLVACLLLATGSVQWSRGERGRRHRRRRRGASIACNALGIACLLHCGAVYHPLPASRPHLQPQSR